MRTTLNIDDDLLADAMRRTGVKEKTSVVRMGLEMLIQHDAAQRLAALFGFVGYTFVKLEVEPAPLLLGFVLGPMMEENLRRALLLSRGDPVVFFQRPISLTLLIISASVLTTSRFPSSVPTLMRSALGNP